MTGKVPNHRPFVGMNFWKGVAVMALLYASLGLIAWCLLVTVQRARGDDKILKPDTVRLDGGVAKYTDNRDDALDEVNAWRARNGYRPFIRDEGLTVAARHAARYRAEHLLFGHVEATVDTKWLPEGRTRGWHVGDFQFLPPGSTAASAGCAAYPARDGWLSCDMRASNKCAGAAWWPGRGGKRYMHIYVR